MAFVEGRVVARLLRQQHWVCFGGELLCYSSLILPALNLRWQCFPVWQQQQEQPAFGGALPH